MFNRNIKKHNRIQRSNSIQNVNTHDVKLLVESIEKTLEKLITQKSRDALQLNLFTDNKLKKVFIKLTRKKKVVLLTTVNIKFGIGGMVKTIQLKKILDFFKKENIKLRSKEICYGILVNN